MISELRKQIIEQIVACDGELLNAASTKSLEQIRFIVGKRIGFNYCLDLLQAIQENRREVELDA